MGSGKVHKPGFKFRIPKLQRHYVGVLSTRLLAQTPMTILMMSLLPFWDLNMVVALLSMGQSYEFIKNILICVPKMNGLLGL